MKFTKIALAALGAAMVLPMSAQEKKNESEFMRSSLYTILVVSKEQNKRLDDETKNAAENEYISMIKGYTKTDEKRAANETETTLASIPGRIFAGIPIPEQFNNHNLGLRILDYDSIRATLTNDQVNALKPKKSGGAKALGFAKKFGAGMLGGASGAQKSSLLVVDEVDEGMIPVMITYLDKNNVADSMIGKWFCLNEATTPHYSDSIIKYRAFQNASAQQLALFKDKPSETLKRANELLDNSYVLAVNLRFRTNKAIVAESEALAKELGNQFGVGGLVSLGGGIASAAAGEGFSVQAVCNLFKIDWNDETKLAVGELIYDKNATLSDLIKADLCKLSLVGQAKEISGVRQSKFSTKPFSELVERATARAIDGGIARLQREHEVFRTITPISGVDEEGNILAKIGMKEGLSVGDKYEILERIEDPETGALIDYKSKGTVEPVKGKIWNNRYGASEEASENASSNNKDADVSADNAINFGASTFKGKKGEDYRGYYLRLKKKK